MKKNSSKYSFFFISIVFSIPFLIFSFASYLYVKKSTESNLISTMSRFNANSAAASIDRPVDEMTLLLRTMSSNLTQESIEHYLSQKNLDIDSVLPSIVNSTFFFRAALLADSDNKFKTYPAVYPDDFEPRERPWYYSSGIKDEITFSDPYKNKLPPYENEITVDMNLFDSKSNIIGNVAFVLDLKAMSRPLKSINAPYNGRFKIVSADGSVILYKNTNEIFRRKVPLSWLEKAKENEGHFYDATAREFVFYRTYSNPNWIAFSVVDYDEFKNSTDTVYEIFYALFAVCLTLYALTVYLFNLYYKRFMTNLFMSINGMQLVEEKGIGEVYNKLKEHNKKLTDAVHESETDTLTGISNRKKFNADLNAAVDKKHPFYLAIIDIDNFKTINDTFGHDIGDIVLTTVCGIGKKVVEDNQGSHIYRYGGEEICVLILSDDEDECFQVLETWRNIINLRKWREEGMHVSFSAGLTKWNETDTPEQIIKRADVCLYNAKTTGKNKIVLG